MPASNLLLFFGRLHPLLVHLPIGFLSLLAAVELASRFPRFKQVGHARGIILGLSALSAIASVTCGLMLATDGGYDADLLSWHKWLGITLAALIIVTSVVLAMGRPKLYFAMLVATLAAMMPASHMGGSMTHGKDYLTEYAPAWLRGGTPTTAPATSKFTSPEQADLFHDVVQPVLAQNCLSCHGQEKTSGGLRLNSPEAIQHGGKSGPAIVARDADASLLLQRMRLPPEDPKHMPPAGKPQPTLDQTAALRWWINAGAPASTTIEQLDVGAEQLDLAARLLKLPVLAETAAPRPLADLTADLADIAAHTKVQLSPAEASQPWISVNASVTNAFGDSELAALAPIANNITFLNLARTRITDAGLATVQKMPNLRELRLDGTRVTDAGLKNLSKLRKLEYLNLYNTPVTDAGLAHLAGIPSLHRLYLWKTQVDPAAAKKFAETKSDPAKIEALQRQIDLLKSQLASQRIDVEGGVPLTTRPTTTRAATGPATKP